MKHSKLFLALLLPFLGISLLAIHYFLIGPILMNHGKENLNTGIYLMLRLVLFSGLGYSLVKWAGRKRPQALAAVLMVGGVDQIFFKGFWMLHDVKIHPEVWAGVEMAPVKLFTGLAQAYLFFIPFVLILAFLGTELTRFAFDLKRDKELAEKKLTRHPEHP